MAYRAYYKAETGIRELYDIVTGKVLRLKTYTIKIPQYGDYKLITTSQLKQD